MELTAHALRGYLDYLRDMGVYDLYQQQVDHDPVVAEQARALLVPQGTGALRVEAPRAVAAPSGPVLKVPTAASSPAAGQASRPAAHAGSVVPRVQPARSGPEIVISAAAAPVPPSALTGLQGISATADDDAPPTDNENFAAPTMPLISFNQLAPLPSTRTPPAAKADALQALRARIGDCTRCPLAYAGRHNIVFADGDPNAQLMFVGEGPGADEDSSGLPFVGKAGQLLNNMIGAMGLKRESVYIANIVMCRPPKNRAPEPAEANTCTQFLLQQIDIVQPRVIVALGSTAATYLLGVKQTLSNLRGRWHDVRGAKCAVTYHPAFLLRDPRQKGEAWKDLQRVMVELDLKPPVRS